MYLYLLQLLFVAQQVADALQRSYGISLTSLLSLLTVVAVMLLLDLLMLSLRIAETIDTGQQILDVYVIQKTYSETYPKLYKVGYH